jgi:uncharacterized protein YbaR (Trm112 family)
MALRPAAGSSPTARKFGAVWLTEGEHEMHLLVCPSCGRRYAVTGARSRDEWQCTKCSQELTVINRDVERLTVMGDVRPTRGELISPKVADPVPGGTGMPRMQATH